MPLYEAIFLLRPQAPKDTVAYIKRILGVVFEEHPTMRVRELQNLGDRAMGKYVCMGGVRNYAGRYLQLIYDGPPKVRETFSRAMFTFGQQNLMTFTVHRIKDQDYINHMYLKAMRHTSPAGLDPDVRNLAFVRDFHRFELGTKS